LIAELKHSGAKPVWMFRYWRVHGGQP